uniref:Putative activator of 90 kDa heat shock protein atpase log 1-like isoform 2 n=1 Tax=Panstrongylus megistus TaxID=65343 RepID=A0A069DS64_9HEMI
MARWGEGDPRWIVEERPDATNVNNWHWTEKNACSWSQDKLKELLVGLRLESDLADCHLSEMEKLEGEAVANNRKGKLIFFYEWDITLSWKGRLKGGTQASEGKIHIPNLSEENDISEVEVTVTLKESSTEGEIIKDFLHNCGSEKIREKLKLYVVMLKEEFSKGMILPKKGAEENHETKDQQITNLTSGFSAKIQMNQVSKSPTNNKDSKTIDVTSLKVSQNFQCKGEDFYRAMTTPEMVSAFTNGPCKLEPKKGGHFELFGGNILGEFVELVPDKKIVQRWRLKGWPAEHYSTVTMDIDQQEDHTVVRISQTGIPKSDVDGTRENWGRYYWDAIKRTFGWGYFM